MQCQLLLPGDVFPNVNLAAIKQTSIGDFMQNKKQFNAIINEDVAGHRLEAKNGEQDRTIEDDGEGDGGNAAGDVGMKGEALFTHITT